MGKQSISMFSSERGEQLIDRFAELLGEGMREGGLLVVVFGILDYYLSDGRLGGAWPLRTSVAGGTLFLAGVGMDLARIVWTNRRKFS